MREFGIKQVTQARQIKLRINYWINSLSLKGQQSTASFNALNKLIVTFILSSFLTRIGKLSERGQTLEAMAFHTR